ncbi:hypothetical protein LKR43_09950 [Pusillimonas sp. MFBS29]|uniref:hypothetical protein n=1 Tax=Pusillimonas sp. MFBS29 TaxID=2886690 RepID=UPI001D116276|nr:hypothetical protein [Pusillimonas sp. MFBS29]MCC2596661.1 hypothetical protein [Pusillimonas sp. MFBS29]
MQRALSLNSSPDIGVPLRLLLSAPVFVLLAALLLLWEGPTAMVSRWTAPTLAITHLLTLGALASAMAGAMMQILPVATGINVYSPRMTSTAVHGLLSSGTLVLAAGFLSGRTGLFPLAGGLLGGALLWLALACAGGLWLYRKQATKGSIEILSATRFAILALAVTATIGVVLAAGWAGWLPLSRPLTDVHAAWGLLGWVGLLIIGMAYQVIPIFQVTELYPKVVTRWLAPALFVLLVAFTANHYLASSIQWEIGRAIALLLLGGCLIFAAITFQLLWTRKRPEPDTTTLFWRTAMISLAGCAPVWLLQISGTGDFTVTLGVLFLVGFAWSAINGMLYKIIPFLLWYHLQKDLTIALRVVPKVKQIIPDEIAARQFWPHLAALLLLVAASLKPMMFTHAAALALAVSVLWLGWNIMLALRLFVRARQEIAQALKTATPPWQLTPDKR